MPLSIDVYRNDTPHLRFIQMQQLSSCLPNYDFTNRIVHFKDIFFFKLEKMTLPSLEICISYYIYIKLKE